MSVTLMRISNATLYFIGLLILALIELDILGLQVSAISKYLDDKLMALSFFPGLALVWCTFSQIDSLPFGLLAGILAFAINDYLLRKLEAKSALTFATSILAFMLFVAAIVIISGLFFLESIGSKEAIIAFSPKLMALHSFFVFANIGFYWFWLKRIIR